MFSGTGGDVPEFGVFMLFKVHIAQLAVLQSFNLKDRTDNG